MECGKDCPIRQSFDIAYKVLEQNQHAYPPTTLTSKKHELKITRDVLDVASHGCEGPDSDGSCARRAVINGACSLLFGKPGMELKNNNEKPKPVGFGE